MTSTTSIYHPTDRQLRFRFLKPLLYLVVPGLIVFAMKSYRALICLNVRAISKTSCSNAVGSAFLHVAVALVLAGTLFSVWLFYCDHVRGDIFVQMEQ